VTRGEVAFGGLQVQLRLAQPVIGPSHAFIMTGGSPES
jgi:hypothetical protein